MHHSANCNSSVYRNKSFLSNAGNSRNRLYEHPIMGIHVHWWNNVPKSIANNRFDAWSSSSCNSGSCEWRGFFVHGFHCRNRIRRSSNSNRSSSFILRRRRFEQRDFVLQRISGWFTTESLCCSDRFELHPRFSNDCSSRNRQHGGSAC